MNQPRPQSLAEKEAETRKGSVLLKHAYLYKITRGVLLARNHPKVRPEVLEIFEELVEVAAKYRKLTGRHLPVLGELGELFAEIIFGLKRHNPMTRGSDGKLGNDFVEVKTITPDKHNDVVQVKRAGNFGKLVVVKISDDFQFGARMVERRILKKGVSKFATLSWQSMIEGAPDEAMHRSFPIKNFSSDRNPRDTDNLDISQYLSKIFQDWQGSRNAFPQNTHPASQWPIPFFGNPNTALVATVGVNPSSGEFVPTRNWGAEESVKDWKLRLKNYFKHTTPAHDWFKPWRTGLALLDCSYEEGTAAHVDVSYRATKAMLRNPTTDRREFSHMVDRDVAWFFRLLPLCPNLRGLLVFGPVVRHDDSTESLAVFIRKSAPRHGFSVLPDGGLGCEMKGLPNRSFFLHEVAALGAGTITEQVMTNLTQHHTNLHQSIHSTP